MIDKIYIRYMYLEGRYSRYSSRSNWDFSYTLDTSRLLRVKMDSQGLNSWGAHGYIDYYTLGVF